MDFPSFSQFDPSDPPHFDCTHFAKSRFELNEGGGSDPPIGTRLRPKGSDPSEDFEKFKRNCEIYRFVGGDWGNPSEFSQIFPIPTQLRPLFAKSDPIPTPFPNADPPIGTKNYNFARIGPSEIILFMKHYLFLQ